MKLKIKSFNWLAGRPVVILNSETAKKLNVHVDERVSLSTHSNSKIYAVVDIFENLAKDNEIGLSHEVGSLINKKLKYLEVIPAGISDVGGLIKKKLSGQSLTEKEVETIVSDIVHNNLTESEIAYFVAAEKTRGLSSKETIYLTEAMVKNGNKIQFNKKIIADKHCVGGIAGNRTTPIVVSICAAAGLIMPKTSSRAITSASGTADVIETISNVEFTSQQIKKLVEKTGACMVWGGSLGLAPSDDKIIYVERILNLDVESQLLASIMSKKIAAGSNHIIIDIPYGDGAKFSKQSAHKLAKKFSDLAKHFKLKVKTVLTLGNQPIGNGIGPILEIMDVIKVLQNKPDAPADLREKSIFLASELMTLCGIKDSKRIAREILETGNAYEKFKEIINSQNNSDDFDKRINSLKLGKFRRIIKSSKTGKITCINNKGINSLCRILGTPETTSAGVYLHRHLGPVKQGEPILTIYSESPNKLGDALIFLQKSKPISVD